MGVKPGVLGLLVVALWATSARAGAACSDRANLLTSPVSGVSLLFNGGEREGVMLLGQRFDGEGSLRVPGMMPAVAELKQGKFGPAGGQVVYLEPDGGGGQRVCRLEKWESRVYSPMARPQPDGTPGVRRDESGNIRAVPYRAVPAQERNSILAKLTPHYYMTRAEAYFHDQGGHLVEARLQETDDVNALSPRYPKTLMFDRLAFCAEYNAKGQLISTTGDISETLSKVPGAQCAGLQVGEVALYTYRYYADGALLAELRTPQRKEEDDGLDARDAPGEWRGQGNAWLDVTGPGAERKGVFFGFFKTKGIYSLSTEYMGFAAYDAQLFYKELSSNGSKKLQYDFPTQPVPLSVIDDQFASLDKYPRIRTYPHRSGSTVMEFFDANRRAPRQRQWRGADLNRQEMYGADGRLTRVIHYGGMSQEVAREDLKRYAESGVLKVTPTTSGYASYRVYDYDAKGKERLVFVCWQHDVPSNKPLRHFPWWTPDPTPKRSREDALIYGMKNVANRCGTPDGKMLIQGMGPINTYMAKQYGYDVEKLSYDQVR
jgi:hypothetical protein